MTDASGLIEGASENRGLGHEFLRHIERTKVLLYVIDIAASDERSPIKELRVLMNEVAQYREDLADRRAMVFLNKIDLEGRSYSDSIETSEYDPVQLTNSSSWR